MDAFIKQQTSNKEKKTSGSGWKTKSNGLNHIKAKRQEDKTKRREE